MNAGDIDYIQYIKPPLMKNSTASCYIKGGFTGGSDELLSPSKFIAIQQ
jgi:hypothetical protein